jgi:hypothetical protein
MNKVKILSIVSIALLITNIAMLTFLWMSAKHRPHPNSNKSIIIEQLGLQGNQLMQYDSLIAIHRKGIRSNQDSIRSIKKVLYSNLNNNTNTANKDSLMQQIANFQKNIELVHYQHFADIKAICTKEQLPAFAELSKQLDELFGNPSKHKKP